METLTQNIFHKFESKAHGHHEGAKEGKLVFDRDRSRYLHKGFWAAMYEEVSSFSFQLQTISFRIES